ncbi:MAG TPA: hypothetical protein VMZ91_04035 [Candidatus Paceibacterota bacterium]|nr:hypothetical protein [Candidatus Paceibacterota bacterium]
MKEKEYITRDELSSDKVWIWRTSKKGFEPIRLKNCDVISWHRENSNLDSCSCYTLKDFKKKFNFEIKKKEKLCIYLDEKILDNQDYQLFSDDPDRKK